MSVTHATAIGLAYPSTFSDLAAGDMDSASSFADTASRLRDYPCSAVLAVDKVLMQVSNDRKLVLPVTFIFLFGTVAFTHSTQYISHLTGVLLFLSFIYLSLPRSTRPVSL
jgi:hypothetical protein